MLTFVREMLNIETIIFKRYYHENEKDFCHVVHGTLCSLYGFCPNRG